LENGTVGVKVARGYVPAGFAMKAAYFLVAGVVFVFVSMLVLTVLHP
jgi:hypothetical protein